MDYPKTSITWNCKCGVELEIKTASDSVNAKGAAVIRCKNCNLLYAMSINLIVVEVTEKPEIKQPEKDKKFEVLKLKKCNLN